jgi:hypothetical protein
LIFVTLIIIVALSRGETYSVSESDDKENVDPEFPEHTPEKGIDNILYDTNGDINIILTIIIWIFLTLAISFFAIKEIISEHALSGKCIAKKRMEKGIVPEINYLINYIVSNTSKRTDFG